MATTPQAAAGKIVVAGYTFKTRPGTRADWTIVRLIPPLVRHDFGTAHIVAASQYSDLPPRRLQRRKIVVSGIRRKFGSRRHVCASSTRTAASTRRSVLTRMLFSTFMTTASLEGITHSADGKFCWRAIPFSLSSISAMYFCEFNSNGAVDPGFGSGGYLNLAYIFRIYLRCRASAARKILVLLDSFFDARTLITHRGHSCWAFFRSGARDASFGANGDVFTTGRRRRENPSPTRPRL